MGRKRRIPITITIDGAVPGGQYEVGALGTRNLAEVREMRVSDGVNSVEWNSCEDPPVERKFNTVANASGRIVLTVSSVSGATIHLSGLSFRRVA